MASPSTIRTLESAVLDEDISRNLHDEFNTFQVVIQAPEAFQQVVLDFQRKTSTHQELTHMLREQPASSCFTAPSESAGLWRRVVRSSVALQTRPGLVLRNAFL